MNRTLGLVALVLGLGMGAAFGQQSDYAPGKVVYDVSTPDPEAVDHILDRASLLQNIYQGDSFEASIVVVLHEGTVPLFSHSNEVAHGDLMTRARSLTMGEVIQFRLCRASARLQGFEDGDFPDFVTLVPMADAEIVRLQQAGYAYIR